MVQDRLRTGYTSPQDQNESSEYMYGARPEPMMSRGDQQSGQDHPGLGEAPDEDRLFAHEHVHYEQTTPRSSLKGFQDPRASYKSGPAYVYDTTDVEEEPTGGPHLGPAQWAAAIISLALIIGLGIWGYKLLVRDVSGVPVIRAIEGAARVLPDEPGGQLAMHQGLAVNSVTADGSAAPPADSYVLAPAEAQLTEEDQPMAGLQPVLSSYEPSTSAYDVQTPEEPAAPLEQVAVEEDPLELDSVEDVVANTADEAAKLIAEEDAPEATVMSSPVPKLRPARPLRLASLEGGSSASLDGVAGDILSAVAGSKSTQEMPASEVPSGSRLVQVGAFQSEDIARTEWDRLYGKFSDLMEDKTRVIEKAESGGKTFYRLRAYGFADASDANRFCAALTAMNAACVPTVQR
ncbi:SPOR domain-containing protein [Celeribacter sp. ULVN23_4]